MSIHAVHESPIFAIFSPSIIQKLLRRRFPRHARDVFCSRTNYNLFVSTAFRDLRRCAYIHGRMSAAVLFVLFSIRLMA